jgi:hypothetical protein
VSHISCAEYEIPNNHGDKRDAGQDHQVSRHVFSPGAPQFELIGALFFCLGIES